MVGERGRQRLKNVVIKEGVPTFVGKDSVQSDQSGFLTFVAPGELSILEVKFFQLANVESVAEERHMTRVNVGIVFVLGTVDEVEVS